ncbi:MAG: deoxyribose-phosphate aldolase [bacterium]|nr:deoxyribose-phosphate aldolase [bacterium]
MNDIASYIDHTLLKPDCTEAQIRLLCEEAAQYNFASVCILPWHICLACEALEATNIPVCTVVGFPLGATHTASKLHETLLALDDGAREIDMVINITALKSGAYDLVLSDILTVCNVVHEREALIKVIIETCLLTEEEKLRMCSMVTQAGADFIKTSTGFSSSGATFEDVALLRENVGTTVRVKASGGIRDYESALSMIAAGAERLGTSSGVAIVNESLTG